MELDRLAQAERLMGHRFADQELLERSLTHASVADSRLDSNERLEFLGDSILGAIVAERVFHAYPDILEGEMTKIKSATVSRQTCALIARELGLEELLELGKGMRSHEELPSSLAACALEAVIAALYIDAGMEAVERFVVPLIDPIISRAAESGHHENYKSLLQHHAQQHMQETPTYRILDEKGPDHSKCFKACVEIGGRRFPASWGQSKKQSEQNAALNALHALGVVEESASGEVVLADEGSDAGDQDEQNLDVASAQQTNGVASDHESG